MKILVKPGVVFKNVARREQIEDLHAALDGDQDKNLAFAPLDIPEEAEAYLDDLDLSLEGDFRDIVNPHGHDHSIGPWKSIFHYEATSEAELEPDAIQAKMTLMPDRDGKTALAETLSRGWQAYWPGRADPRGMSCSLKLIYPADKPKLHLDDDVIRRGLACLRGDPEHGGMHYINNGGYDFWQRQEGGYPFLNPIGTPGHDIKVESHHMSCVPMRHMSIHRGIVYKTAHTLFYDERAISEETGLLLPLYEQRVIDPMYQQNPLGHTEPSSEQCPEPRLTMMVN